MAESKLSSRLTVEDLTFFKRWSRHCASCSGCISAIGLLAHSIEALK
jgi:hypothetical protein